MRRLEQGGPPPPRPSEADAIALVEDDVYTREGVWHNPTATPFGRVVPRTCPGDRPMTRRRALSIAGRSSPTSAAVPSPSRSSGVAACAPAASSAGARQRRLGRRVFPARGRASPTARSASALRVGRGRGALAWSRVNLGFVSAYLLVHGGEAALVDTGVENSADAIEAALGRYRSAGRPSGT